MTFNGSTKLTDILREYPWLPDELVKLDDRFKIIKTPVGRALIKKMTITDMSKKIGYSEEDIIGRLKSMIEEHEK